MACQIASRTEEVHTNLIHVCNVYIYICKPGICTAGLGYRHLPSDAPEGWMNTIKHQLNIFLQQNL